MSGAEERQQRLCERASFRRHLDDAALFFAKRGIPVEYIEKDYYITECLRVVQAEVGGAVVFKGGTSLSKGWALIDRFSEDIDLFIDPLAFVPSRGGKAMRTTMRKISARIATDLALVPQRTALRAARGIARTERFAYQTMYPSLVPVAREVCLASGVGSGREPVAQVMIQSLLGEFLRAVGVDLQAPDLDPFAMKLLHFRRTFVEKLFAIDHAVAVSAATALPIGPRARHYFDLAALAVQPEVRAMLEGSEYRRIIRDCVEIDRRFYRRAARDPEAWSFRQSPALFPSARLSAALRAEYETQCELLCFGAYPPWPEVLARLEALRQRL